MGVKDGSGDYLFLMRQESHANLFSKSRDFTPDSHLNWCKDNMNYSKLYHRLTIFTKIF